MSTSHFCLIRRVLFLNGYEAHSCCSLAEDSSSYTWDGMLANFFPPCFLIENLYPFAINLVRVRLTVVQGIAVRFEMVLIEFNGTEKSSNYPYLQSTIIDCSFRSIFRWYSFSTSGLLTGFRSWVGTWNLYSNWSSGLRFLRNSYLLYTS